MLYSQLCAKGRHCSVWGRWGAFKTTHYLVQNVVAKLINGTDAASVCCFLGHARLCCFIKMKKLGFFSPSWTNARAAGRAISLCYKNECKHNHVFLGGIVENSSWNLWRVSSLRELVLSCRASCHIRATPACCSHIFASSGAGTGFYECQKSRH